MSVHKTYVRNTRRTYLKTMERETWKNLNLRCGKARRTTSVLEAIAPMSFCTPHVVTKSMSQRRPGGFALQNAKWKTTTTWRSPRRVATDAVHQTAFVFQYDEIASNMSTGPYWHISTPYLRDCLDDMQQDGETPCSALTHAYLLSLSLSLSLALSVS